MSEPHLSPSEIRACLPHFLDEVRAASRVVIGTHLNPDGDALGSALAVAHVLDQLEVEYDVLCNNAAPANLSFLPGVKRIKQKPKETEHDLAIILDLNTMDRLGSVQDYFLDVPRTILIDHHIAHEEPGDLRIVSTLAPATASILCDLFDNSDVDLTPDIACCLLTGILTDTGNFRFPNTTPHALHQAAMLLERGADLAGISREVYMTKALPAVQLLGWSLDNMHLEHKGRLAWTMVPFSVFEGFTALDEHTEGIVNELLSIRGVDVAAFARETGSGKFKVSLRSRGDLDMSLVARDFGGGGHKNAAGLTLEGGPHVVEQDLIPSLKKCLESS